MAILLPMRRTKTRQRLPRASDLRSRAPATHLRHLPSIHRSNANLRPLRHRIHTPAQRFPLLLWSVPNRCTPSCVQLEGARCPLSPCPSAGELDHCCDEPGERYKRRDGHCRHTYGRGPVHQANEENHGDHHKRRPRHPQSVHCRSNDGSCAEAHTQRDERPDTENLDERLTTVVPPKATVGLSATQFCALKGGCSCPGRENRGRKSREQPNCSRHVDKP